MKPLLWLMGPLQLCWLPAAAAAAAAAADLRAEDLLLRFLAH